MVKIMSDPVKNAEVEDVLSSIRRLVSEEKRPLQKPKAAQLTDRLVLTPALRVADASGDAAPKEVAKFKSDRSGDARTRSDFADSLADDYDDDPYDFDSFEATDDKDDQIDVAASSTITSFEVSRNVAAEADAQSAELSAKIAALETAIGDISDEWEPDGSSTDDFSGSDFSTMKWEDEVDGDVADQVDDNAVSDPTEILQPTQVHKPVETPSTPATEPLELKPEDAVVKRAEGDNLTFETVGEAYLTSEIGESPDTSTQQDTASHDTSEAGIDFGAEDQVLDEAALRDIVSEIVHAELQGALGERITRNVRRLVRREIHRALTARELD